MAPGASKPPTHLPDTLAQRIQTLREALGFSRDRLAQHAALSLQDIEDLEAGILLFLSPAVRQNWPAS